MRIMTFLKSKFINNKFICSRDFYVGLFFLIFAIILVLWLIPSYVSGYYDESTALTPRSLPYLIVAVLGFLSLALIYISPETSKELNRAVEKRFTWVTGLLISILFGYYLGVIVFGMVPSSIVVLIIFIRIYGFKRWVANIIYSIVLISLLFLFFAKVAHTPIP